MLVSKQIPEKYQYQIDYSSCDQNATYQKSLARARDLASHASDSVACDSESSGTCQ